MSETLDRKKLAIAVRTLSRCDGDLGRIVAVLGAPPMWARRPGFSTLVYTILEQQISVLSARATFRRLQQAVGRLSPKAFLALSHAALRQIGFSGRKIRACRGLAAAIAERSLDLAHLHGQDSHSVKRRLIELDGIGPWTADMYLLLALKRADAWPVGDVPLARAVKAIKALPRRPSPQELDAIGEKWAPWRGVATRILWHYDANAPLSLPASAITSATPKGTTRSTKSPGASGKK